MNFFARRRWRKIIKHALHEARHARHMREDIAAPEDLEALRNAENEVSAAWRARDEARLESALDGLAQALSRVAPPRPSPRIRENVEILAVAVAVAMGVRTYFVQPFKIPTGSMQPTLYGIDVKADATREWLDVFPLNILRLALFGERYVEVRAQASGPITLVDRTEEGKVYSIGGRLHHIRSHLREYPLQSPYVEKGQLLASGRVRQGDHIFVNKVRYNFAKPKRGDIFVFSTDGIQYPGIRPDSFYIKRVAGLPGERISIDPPYLVADGRRITSPYPFERLVKATDQGYVGYQLPEIPFGYRSDAKIQTRFSTLALGDHEYLPLGDNTRSSLDGRYFGAVQEVNIVGPAFMVYWPFGKRWGLVQ